MRLILPVAALAVSLLGCTTLQSPTPLPTAEWQAGVRLVSVLPESALPDGAVVLEGNEWVWLPSVSTARAVVDMLMPVPLVVSGVMNQVHQGQAHQVSAWFSGLSPGKAVRSKLMQRNTLATYGHGVEASVFCFVQEGSDDHYRFALVAQLQDGSWSGRYVVHLPLALTLQELQRAKTNGDLKSALDAGAGQMADLFDKAARGELSHNLAQVTIGSLNLVSSKPNGVLPPTLITAKSALLVEEGTNHVIVRISGDVNQAEGAGGLFFGVHYLLKSQLHTYEMSPA